MIPSPPESQADILYMILSTICPLTRCEGMVNGEMKV